MSKRLPSNNCRFQSLLLSQPKVFSEDLKRLSQPAVSGRLILVADHFAHVEKYADIAQHYDAIAIRIQIESAAIGFGSRPGLDCVMLAKAIQRTPRLCFDGIQLHLATTQETEAQDVRNAVGTLNQTTALLQKNGLQNFVQACNHIEVCRQLQQPREWLCEFCETNHSVFARQFDIELEPVHELQATVISRPQHLSAVVNLERSQFEGRNQLSCESGIRIARSFADHSVLSLSKSARELFIGDQVSFFIL